MAGAEPRAGEQAELDESLLSVSLPPDLETTYAQVVRIGSGLTPVLRGELDASLPHMEGGGCGGAGAVARRGEGQSGARRSRHLGCRSRSARRCRLAQAPAQRRLHLFPLASA